MKYCKYTSLNIFCGTMGGTSGWVQWDAHMGEGEQPIFPPLRSTDPNHSPKIQYVEQCSIKKNNPPIKKVAVAVPTASQHPKFHV